MPEHKLTLDQVRHVAKLARLWLSDEQLAKMSTHLAAIIGYIDKMAQVDTTGVEPMAQPLPMHNVLRDDVPSQPLPLDKVLQNAPDADSPFFKVPKVIGAEEDSAG